MLEKYYIEGTENLAEHTINCIEYNDPNFWPSFQSDFIAFKNIIIEKVKHKLPFVIIRLFDGEMLFLTRQRDDGFWRKTYTLRNLRDIDMGPYQAFLQSDIICMQLHTEIMNNYNVLYGHIRKIDYPMEYVYSIVANKWIFNTFKNKIGIIGGEYKIKAIKALMKYKDYQEYIGTDYFTDYITIPERHACDSIEEIENNILNNLKNSTAEVILFGISFIKLALANKFKSAHNAVYIDIGFGITALSGFGDITRPYYGNWKNYRMRDFNYGDIDKWFCDDDSINNVIYLN